MGPADLVIAFLLFGTDVQQSDGRSDRAMDSPVERLAHDGELHQLGRVGRNVGADVEHGGDPAHGRPAGDDGGPVQVFRHHPQDKLGDGHQGAGVAPGDRGLGLPGPDRLHRVPKTGSLAATKRLGRLVVHGDDQIGVTDVARRLGRGQFVQRRCQLGLVAMQQEPDIPVPHAFQGERDARRDNRGAVVAPHGVDGDHNGVRHGAAWAPQQGPYQGRADHT